MFEYFRSLVRGRSTRVALLVGTVTALAASSLALADEHEPADDPLPLVEEESTDPVPIEGRPEDGLVVFSLPDESGAHVDCSEVASPSEEEPAVVDAEDSSIEGDETVAAEASEITQAEDCFFVSAEGPNGQWNHGQSVRAFVHALKSGDVEGLFEVEGPRGQLIRNAARSNIGKEANDGGSLEPIKASTQSSHPGKGKGKAKGRR